MLTHFSKKMVMRSKIEIFIVFLFSSNVMALNSDVGSACKNSQLGIVYLDYQNREQNLSRIKAQLKNQGDLARHIQSFYSTPPTDDEAKLLSFVSDANQKFIPESSLKRASLKYSSDKQKLSDSEGYRRAVIEALDILPQEYNKLNWLLTLKDPLLTSSVLRPASRSELDSVSGASTNVIPSENAKFKMEIIFSSNSSEPIPYLIPLLAHEFQHASEYRSRIALLEDQKKYIEFILVDEAKANDVQMRSYVYLAKKHPEIFCDWLYVSWSYGNLVVPLSWAMASKEREMREGKFLYWYATKGNLRQYKYLLKSDGSGLRDDLQKKVTEFNLPYVK